MLKKWKLALRHLTRHWRLNLVLLTIMVLGTSLQASLPMLAITIAGESFSQTLENAPINTRNIIIRGKIRHNEPSEDIEQILGGLLLDMISVRETDITGSPIISKSDGTKQNLYPATLVLDLRSFDPLENRVRILHGHLPEIKADLSAENEQPILEAAIGAEAAQRVGLEVGDEIFSAGGRYHLRIVGIVEPLHPNSEVWWEDKQMLPFTAWRRISFSPDIDEWNLSLLLPPQTMISEIYHKHHWRVILDHEKITILNASNVSDSMIRLQRSISEEGMILKTGLIDLIMQFEESLALAQVSLLLLTFQSLLAIFFLLGVFGNFLVEQSRMELETLSGRGFSRGQITGLFARSSILLALLAGYLAPWLARWFLKMWSGWLDIPAPDFIPVESQWLALFTAMFGWVILVISVYRGIKGELLVGQGRGMRAKTRSQNQRHPIWDVFILTLGGLAYWQLVQGSKITREVNGINADSITGIADPILLLGPTLLLLAASLIVIRLLPFLWHFFVWISQKTRGLLGFLGFSRLSRQPGGSNQVTLLISLSAGLIIFASVFTYSIENWQQAMARYVTGADVRVRQSLIEPFEGSTLVDIPGINGTTEVIRADVTFQVSDYRRLGFDMLAVDPVTFPSVVTYPFGVSRYSMIEIIRILQTGSSNGIPLIISKNVNTRHLNIGDEITLEMGAETYPFEIVGIIPNFPLLDDVFAVTDLSRITQQIDMEILAQTNQGSRETLIAVDSHELEKVIATLTKAGFGDSIVGNSLTQLVGFQNNLVFREVTTAFNLNALVLIPLSGLGFFLMQLFSTQRRTAEFNILQSLGLSKSQLRGMLVFEGLIFIVLGLLVGTGIGFGLAFLIHPFVSQILPSLVSDFALKQMLIDWPEIGVQFLALIGFYGFGLLVLMINAIRNMKSIQFWESRE